MFPTDKKKSFQQVVPVSSGLPVPPGPGDASPSRSVSLFTTGVVSLLPFSPRFPKTQSHELHCSAQWPPVAPGHHTEQHRSKTFTSKGSIRQCCSKSLFCLQVNTYGRRPQPMVCASYCIVQKNNLNLIGHSWLQGTNYVQIVKLSQIMKFKSKCTKYIHTRQNQ